MFDPKVYEAIAHLNEVKRLFIELNFEKVDTQVCILDHMESWLNENSLDGSVVPNDKESV